MKLKGQQTVPAPQERVWQALLDPETLARTIPGCEALEPVGDHEYHMKMKLAISSVQGLFDGKVRLENQQPPASYRLHIDGRGKIGFVNGFGDFTLEPQDQATAVHYQGEVKVGGLIASVGQRLMDMSAKMMINRFFAALSRELQQESSSAAQS